jgi:hypothetical protein
MRNIVYIIGEVKRNMEDSNIIHEDEYFLLLKNLGRRQKLKLISELSNSLLETDSKQEEKFYSLYGKLDIKESADELIQSIREARYFGRPDVAL